MKDARSLLTAGLLLILACRAEAQVGVPAAPAADAAAAGVAPATTSAAAPRTLWNFLGITPENCAKCQARFCSSNLATLSRSMLSPARMMTGGGLLPPCCPPFLSASQIASGLAAGTLSPAEAAAAKIKADEASSKARRLAVRYLGTVDCHFYPEAEAGIISALRSDRIECVRMEAALALLNGCCCTKKTIEALNLVITGADTDGNPAETSDRVKCLANLALARCMSVPVGIEMGPAIVPSEPPELPYPSIVTPAGLRSRPVTPVAEDPSFVQAHRLYAERLSAPKTPKTSTTSRSLFDVYQQARAPLEASTPEAVRRAPASASAAPPPLRPIGVLPQ